MRGKQRRRRYWADTDFDPLGADSFLDQICVKKRLNCLGRAIVCRPILASTIRHRLKANSWIRVRLAIARLLFEARSWGGNQPHEHARQSGSV